MQWMNEVHWNTARWIAEFLESSMSPKPILETLGKEIFIEH